MKLNISCGGYYDRDVDGEDTSHTQATILAMTDTSASEVVEEDEEDEKPRKRSKGGRKGYRARRMDYSI